MKTYVSLFAALFMLIPAVFVAIGAGMAWRQHRKITTYQPAPATVLATRVDRHVSHNSRGGSSVSYKPVVRYRYEAGGQTHESEEILPVSQSSSQSWARSIVSRYKAGQRTTAYHDPADPSSAFLLRQYTFFPYVFILFPMIFFVVAIGVAGALRLSDEPAPPAPQADGWFAVRPQLRVADKRRRARFVAAVWWSVGVAACGHYFSVAAWPWEMLAVVATAIYAALGCVPLGLAIYYALLQRHVRDATLLINTQRIRLGDQITVLVEQPLRADRFIEELSASLVCEESIKYQSGGKTRFQTRTRHEDCAVVLQKHAGRARETLSAQQAFTVPHDQPPSSPPGQKQYPRYAWRVEVKTAIADGPDYRARFPIAVKAAPGETP